MGKRSNFDRIERDFYPTPYAAVEPLLPHLADQTSYIEPCAGDGALVDHLSSAGHRCIRASDIEPQRSDIARQDVFDAHLPKAMTVITNPPWDRKLLHPLIDKLIMSEATSWLLFDADWMHTKQAANFIGYCGAIVSVGRVKWIPDSKGTGKDNCCWYRFDPAPARTEFFGRL